RLELARGEGDLVDVGLLLQRLELRGAHVADDAALAVDRLIGRAVAKEWNEGTHGVAPRVGDARALRLDDADAALQVLAAQGERAREVRGQPRVEAAAHEVDLVERELALRFEHDVERAVRVDRDARVDGAAEL